MPVVRRSYVADGLNRYASVSGTSYAYDARGNLTNDGVRRFCFDLENRLTGVAPVSLDPCAAPSTLALGYDPLGRLQQTSAGTTATQFLYDGDRLVAEFDGAGTLLRRYVHGAGVDEPLVWYEGAGTSDRRHLAADNQGSVIASSGAGVTRYAYGPYGEPDSWAGGRFRYTGQIALSEVALYHYKARVYDPVLGRFLQTDPVGYQDQMNLYAYVGNDPVNATDPTGMDTVCSGVGELRTCTVRSDTHDPETSNGQTTRGTPETDQAAVSGKGVVAGSWGRREKLGFIQPDGNGQLGVKRADNTRATSGDTADTASAPVPADAKAVIHGHIDGRSEGMVDKKQGPGDTQSLTLRRPIPNYTVSEGRVGVHEIVNGRLQFRMVEGQLSSREEAELQDNLNRQQQQFQGGGR